MRSRTRMSAAVAAVAVAALLAFAPAAGAAKGGGKGGGGGGSTGGTSSISLVLLNSTDGLPHYGQQITFDTSTATSKPYVSVRCTQDGALVYSADTGYFSGYPWPWTQTMTLTSGAWTGGGANCSARLYSMSNSGATTTLATLGFQVYA